MILKVQIGSNRINVLTHRLNVNTACICDNDLIVINLCCHYKKLFVM